MMSILFMSARAYNFIKTVKLLLNRKADINSKDNKARSCLMNSCYMGHSDMVELLLDYDEINIDLQDNSGKTSLMYACRFNCIEIFKLLLNYNVNINLRDTIGRTALMHALEKKHTEIVKLLEKHKSTPFSLNRISVNFINSDGASAQRSFIDKLDENKKSVFSDYLMNLKPIEE